MQLNRRKFILTGLIAAPAVIAVNHLMPVKPQRYGNDIIISKIGMMTIFAHNGHVYRLEPGTGLYIPSDGSRLIADGSTISISLPSFSIDV